MRFGRLCSDKLYNEFILSLREHAAHISAFKNPCGCMKYVRQFLEYRFSEKIQQEGFQNKTMKYSGGLVSTLYWKDPVELLRNQVRVTPFDGFVSTPMSGDVYTHPMNALIGQKACRMAEKAFKQCNKFDVCWRTITHDGEK